MTQVTTTAIANFLQPLFPLATPQQLAAPAQAILAVMQLGKLTELSQQIDQILVDFSPKNGPGKATFTGR